MYKPIRTHRECTVTGKNTQKKTRSELISPFINVILNFAL